MSNESGTWRGFAAELGTHVRRSATERLDEEFIVGFNEAANISVGLLTAKIDELMSRMQSGSYLSEPDQQLLAQLAALKTETEESLRKYWEQLPSE